MPIINLKDIYPWYGHDEYIEITDEMLEVMETADRQEKNYIRRRYYNKAHYSLDAGDGIEHHALFFALSPCEIYERKLTIEQLCAALNSLPEAQGRRIEAHYLLGISKADIAQAEGVDIRNVRKSISTGLRNMEIYLKNLG